MLSSIIDPVLAPLRSVIPPRGSERMPFSFLSRLGGFDISFMVLWCFT